MSKKNVKSIYLWGLILGISIPFLFSLIAVYLIFGNYGEALGRLIDLKGRPNLTSNAVISLSYIITILVSFYGILATSVFSFLVWRVSVGSYSVSKDLKKLEEIRDEENTREQALIVYYDLQRGFLYVQDLYISIILNKGAPNPRRIHFSEDWIKNVASLRKGLTREEINEVYHLYDKFFTLQSLLINHERYSEVVSEEISIFVRELGQDIFADYIPLELLADFKSSSTEDLLNIEKFILIQKIFLLTFNKEKIRIEKETGGTSTYLCDDTAYYKQIRGNKFNGEGILYNSIGKEKAKGEFFNGIFTTGVVYGYFDKLEKQYKVEYQSSSSKREIIKSEILDPKGSLENKYFFNGNYKENILTNGTTTLFYVDGTIKYRGEVVDGEKEGNGTSFSNLGKPHFTGLYKEGRPSKGKLFRKGKEYFNGDFKNGKPWNGKVNNFDMDHRKIKNFTGELKFGLPHNGTGIRFKRNQANEDLDFVLYQENWEPPFSEEYEERLEEEYNAMENIRIREASPRWEDYIRVDWKDGHPEERKDTESNLTVYSFD